MLRLFTFNPDVVYDRDGVVARARVTPDVASRELQALARADVVSRKTFYKEVVRPGSKAMKKRKTIGWVLNAHYPYKEALVEFLQATLVVSESDLRKRIRTVGPVKLLALTGHITGDKDRGIDMLVVGDKMSETAIKNMVAVLEAECGREVRYVVLETDEYRYRRRVRDKLLRDIMDFPHTEIVNRIGE